MDEFAELEQEFLEMKTSSDDSLQEVLNLLDKDELKPDYTISHEDITYTPAKKFGTLVLGVILIVMILPMVVGVALIIHICKLGPLWSTTRHIMSTDYLGFCHSILEYEYKNEHLIEAKLTKLNHKSYVYIGSVDSGDHSSRDVFALVVGGQESKELWPTGSIKNNYQNVKDFCEISGVKLAISPSARKRNKLNNIS